MAIAGKVALARKTVAEAAADELRSRILSGALQAGSQLRQEVLAAELGVSRIPLREAFRLLEGEGLVTIVPHRGAVVSVLSPEEIGELFELRALIEPDLIRHAVPHLTTEDLRNAAEALAGYESAFQHRDVESWGSLNTRFHVALYRAARRPRTLALAQSLLDQTDRYTRMQLLLTSGESCAQREHQDLLAACRAGDPVLAGTLMEQHVRNAGATLVAFMRKQAT